MPDKSLAEIAADVVVEWTQELIDDMTGDLQKQVKSKSNALAQSIVPDFAVTGSKVTMELELNDYYDYVDKGVSGKLKSIPKSPYTFKTLFPNKKFADALAEWITAAGVKIKPGKGDIFKRRQSFAYAIAVNKKKYGLDAKPFFDKNLSEIRINNLADRLSEALGRQIEIRLLE